MMTKHRILLVDDEPDFLDGMRECLEHAGYEVRTADRVAVAWETLKVEPVDMVLLDVRLPDENGLDLCRRIRRDVRLFAIPVILVTVAGAMSDVLRGFAAGATEYLAKPVRHDELLAQVRRLCGGRAR